MKKLLLVLAALWLAALASVSAPFSPVQAATPGGTLVYGMQKWAQPKSFDPADFGCGNFSALIGMQIYEGLTQYDASGNTIPAIASSWSTTNGKTWIFNLRHNVSFHNGRQLKAQDVIDSWNRALAPGCWSLPFQFKSLQVVNDFKLKVVLKRPYTPLPDALAFPLFFVVPGEAADNLKKNPVGTGPFVFNKWKKGDYIELKRNANYYGSKAFLKTLTFKFYASIDDEYSAFNAGAIQVSEIPPAAWGALKSDPNVIAPYPYSIRFILLDTAIYTDSRVRQAMQMAIDRSAILGQVTWDYDTPPLATGLVPPGIPGYSNADLTVTYDPTQALNLLDQADWSDTNGDGILDNGEGTNLTAVVQRSATGSNRTIQEAIGNALGNIGGTGVGFEVTYVSYPGAAAVYFTGWMPDWLEPDETLYPWLDSKGFLNSRSHYHNPTVDADLANARTTLDRTARYALQHDAEQIAVQTDAVLTPFYYDESTPLIKTSNVNDLSFVPALYSSGYFKTVWLSP